MTCRTSGCELKGRNARSSMGTPRMGRNCFGSPGPARTPAPAATTTTPTSGREAAGELTDSLQPNHLELVALAAETRREEDAAESLARRFGQAPLDARDEQRRGTSDRCGHRRAGGACRAPREERGGGIGDRLEARARHAKDANLVHRAEAILHCTQDPVVERGFALEVQHGIDDVLKRL